MLCSSIIFTPISKSVPHWPSSKKFSFGFLFWIMVLSMNVR